jgi:hypothetical protein
MHPMFGLVLALALGGDGKEGTVLAKVPDGYRVVEGTLRFAHNGSKAAFVAAKGSKQRPVVGATLGDEYDTVAPPVIHPTGAHIAFRAMTLDRNKYEHWTLLYDGKPFANDDWVGEVALAPNDGTPAFWLSHGRINNADGSLSHGPMFLQFGKSKSKKWQGTEQRIPPFFSTDGKFVVSVGTRGGDTNIISLDSKGKESKYEVVSNAMEAIVSPDGKDLACSCLRYRPGNSNTARQFYVQREGLDHALDKEAVLSTSEIYSSAASPVFSPNGKRIAYKVEVQGRFSVGVDSWAEAKLEFDFVDEIEWSPDSANLAFVACRGCKLDDRDGFEILGGTRATGGKWLVVHGSERSAEFECVRYPRWSPDSKQFAFAARADHKWRVIVGTKSSEPCDEIAELVWAEDGHSVSYGCQMGDELSWRKLALD